MSKDRHNAIRPTSQVFTPEEGIVFEVALEPGTSAFTWAVLREVEAGTETVAVGWKPRSGGRKPAAEHSISLISASEWDDHHLDRWKEGDDTDASLDEGDYRLALYDGKPAAGETGFAYIEHATELDQDAFSVSDQRVSEQTTGDGAGHRQAAPRRAGAGGCDRRGRAPFAGHVRRVPRVPRGRVGAG